MSPVTIKIVDSGKTIEIPWRADMNAQEALETAYDQEKAAGRAFSFAVQYFGSYQGQYLGYLVIMIDGQYDDPKNTNDYWLFEINGKPASVGIDNLMVNEGDVIAFDYQPPTSSSMLHNQHGAKHEYYSKL